MTTLTDCGCQVRVHPDGSGAEIDFCPLHQAAPLLLQALKNIHSGPSLTCLTGQEIFDGATAIDQAEGR